MGGMLWMGWGVMAKAAAALSDVILHAKVRRPFCIIPIEMDAKK